VRTLRDWLTERLVRFLTQPLSRYERRYWNDLGALRRHIRKGDVLLVEGDQRVSALIKYLTQSCWSHAVFYIGDELVRRGGVEAQRAIQNFGEEAEHLIVEALMEGVLVSPLSKYIDYNIRLVRPHRLRPEHRKILLDEAVAAIGWKYDLKNITDLCVHLFPFTFLPGRFRRRTPRFGSDVPTQVICSSLLGQLFHHVRFPVIPIMNFPDEVSAVEVEPEGPGWRRLLRRRPRTQYGVFRTRHPSLLTPADFDLSPYFEVIKFNVIADKNFEYQAMTWAEDLETPKLSSGEEEDRVPLASAALPRADKDPGKPLQASAKTADKEK